MLDVLVFLCWVSQKQAEFFAALWVFFFQVANSDGSSFQTTATWFPFSQDSVLLV